VVGVFGLVWFGLVWLVRWLVYQPLIFVRCLKLSMYYLFDQYGPARRLDGCGCAVGCAVGWFGWLVWFGWMWLVWLVGWLVWLVGLVWFGWML
jgi:hypothetical protein